MESIDDIISNDTNLIIEKFVEVYENSKIYFMFYIFKNASSPLFVWVSDNANLDALNISMKVPMETLPITSELLNGASSSEYTTTLSQRLVLKFKVPTMLSYSISQDIPQLTAFIEKTLFELLSVSIKKVQS
ncbi:hypothetical protein CYY_000931 [Polysphondylium violaceum]|uniref:Proteasome assembly chaperone 4 n=1 Tax=Polysphondylium violaceum TaxID=133409 RepID=A0A8J4VB19_9MYCE|nr:hypothetical protein CYY_000931 [Polysphondylium violaceum]